MLGLCAVAFGLRVAGLDYQSLWRDEVDALRFASRPLSDLLHSFVTPGENGPLYFLLLRPWLGFAGQSEFALRFFSVVFGVLAVPLVYRLGRRLFPPRTRSAPFAALVAALLMATSPYLVWYGQEGKMYTLGLFLVLLSMDRFLAALEGGGWQRWLSYVVATSAAMYVHLIAVLIVPVQVVTFLLLDRETRSARWRPWLMSLAALTVPYLPLLAWQFPLLLEPADTGFRFVPLHQMLLSLLASYSLGVAQGSNPWILGLFVGALLGASLFRVGQGPRLASLGIVLCWLLLPVVGLFLITLVRPLYTARYLVFVLPAYYLLLAVGLVTIGRRAPALAGLLLGALLAVNGWGVWLQARTPIKADFRGATEYVREQLTPGDLVLFQIPYGRYSFDYYARLQPGPQSSGAQGAIGLQADEHHMPTTGRWDHRVFLPAVNARVGDPYRWAEGLYTNAGMSPSEVDARMHEALSGSRVVWLVATEVPMWDERGLVQDWLAKNATLTDESEFVRVTVSRYERP